MKLLGNDFSAKALLRRIDDGLKARGLPPVAEEREPAHAVEPAVDPLTFYLGALEEHADATQPLPLHTHRGGLGRAVLVAKSVFRKTCQVFINETLARQRLFNGHVRDSYAQLSAEVQQLRREVEAFKKVEASRKRQPRR